MENQRGTAAFAAKERELREIEEEMEWDFDHPAAQQSDNQQTPPPPGQQPPPPGQQPFNNGQSPPPAGQQPLNNGQSPPPAAGQQPIHNSLTPSPAPSDFMEQYGQYDVDTITVSFQDLTLEAEGGTLLGYLNRGAPGVYNIYQLGGPGQFKRYYAKRTGIKSGTNLKAARKPMEGYQGNVGIQGVVVRPGADISALIPSRWPFKPGKYGENRLQAPWCLVKVVPLCQKDGPAFWMTRGWVRQNFGKNPLIVAHKDYVYKGKTVVERGTEIGYADLEIISAYIANQENYGREPHCAPGTFRKSPSLDREVVPPPPPLVTTEQPASGVQFAARPATRLSPLPQYCQAPAQPGQVVYPCLPAAQAAHPQWVPTQAQPGQLVYPNNQLQAVQATALPGQPDPVAGLLAHQYWPQPSLIKQEA
ncbi:hypothetical protein V2A60_008697 [Cordyceps javanica]